MRRLIVPPFSMCNVQYVQTEVVSGVKGLRYGESLQAVLANLSFSVNKRI
jgi:hypothetical protein